MKKLVLILLFLSTTVRAPKAQADIKVMGDGESVIWSNNSQTFSISASSSMSASINYLWPVADATSGGQALLSDGSGLLSWGIPTTSAAHNILSSTHDATTNAVTRGSIIYGNSTPKWDELVIGVNQKVFVSDGTDPSWGTVDISGGTNLAVNTDHLKLTGDTVDISDDQDTNFHTWQGSFLEQIDFTISEAGGTVTGSLEKEGTGDLTMYFSDEFTALDCTPAVTVNLTSLVGSDTSPATAFVYIPQSTKTPTAAGSWPANSTEYIRVASIVLQSAATTGTDGALMNRNWNDMAFGITSPRGHGLHIGERLRFEHALWSTGVVLSITGSGTGTVTLDTTSGTVYQLHLHSFPAVDMAGTGDIHLVNLSSSEYSTSVNLVADITTLADGVTSLGNNKYFNIVIWGVQNRTGEKSHLMCNLPVGQYTQSADATADINKFSVYTIPSAFRGTGFLVAELTFQLTGGGTTWTTVQNKDLLGQTPTLTPGGGTTANITIFSDGAFEIFDNADDAKRFDFEASGITTGNTRTLTVPDVSTNMWADDGSVPLTANWDVGAFDIRAQTGTFDSLTSGRVAFISTNGLLVDDSDMTFSTDRLTVTGLTVTGNSVFGLNSSVFQPNTDSTTFFQILDADGGTPTFNVDTTNEKVEVNGNVIIGNTSENARLSIMAEGLSTPDVYTTWFRYAGAFANGSIFFFSRAKGSPSSPTQVVLNDTLGTFFFSGYVNDWANNAATLKVKVDDTPGINIMPARFEFGVAQADGTIVNRLTIKSTGNIGFSEVNPETLLELTHATPTITGHVSTHSDAADSGAWILRGKREDGAGTETESGRITMAHDGAGANDQLTYMLLGVNTGAGVVEAMRIDSSLGITFAGALAGAWDMGSQALTNVNIDSGVITGITDLTIADGGTGQSTAQAAIDALSAVSGATNEHVLTKDTGTGNAVWKVTTAVGGDEKVKIDAAAAAGYIGAANSDGVLRAGTGLTYTDGGDFITLGLDYTPTSYAGEESVTFPNGFIFKHGTESVAGNGTNDVTYGAAFPTGIVSMSCSYNDNSVAQDDPCCIQQKAGNLLTIAQVTNGHSATRTINWQVWGY